MITQELLKKLFNYNPNTGVFVRLVTTSTRAMSGTVADNRNANGYVRIGINGKNYSAHRLAWAYMYGEMPIGDIDHINQVKSDNRIENLRIATNSENQRNAKRSVLNRSGFTGVSWNKNAKKWRSSIMSLGNAIHLGSFSKLSDAVEARVKAERQYGFNINHGS